MVPGPTLQLQAQALLQVSGPHSGGVRRLEFHQRPLHGPLGQAAPPGQLRQGLIQKSSGIQPVQQKFHPFHHIALQLSPHKLGENIPFQIIVLIQKTAHAGKRVSPPLFRVLGMIVGVLPVAGSQAPHPAAELLQRIRCLLRLRQLQHGIFLKNLLYILPQFLYVHLKDLDGLGHLGCQHLGLPLGLTKLHQERLHSTFFSF